MTNCILDLKSVNIEFMVGLYARQPGEFSPLVEDDGIPVYTRLDDGGEIPEWTA